MIDGIGGIVVFVSNQVKAIEFYKKLEYRVFDFCCISFFITGNGCQSYIEV